MKMLKFYSVAATLLFIAGSHAQTAPKEEKKVEKK